jgi:hypothetical protein
VNFLPNGTVLPFGLMGISHDAGMAGFNKTYRNTALRLGIVVNSYDISDPINVSKLTTEYDVLVFEQMEDKGSSVIKYKNCISAEGMGSIADFFERTLRVRQNSSTQTQTIDTKNQNGAVVLILCLDGMSEKAIIIGAVTHPDRKTTLAGQTAHLEGEFNGVNIQVNEDGSANFTFNGPTNNDGTPVDSSITPTVLSVAADGSFQVMHSAVTFTLAKSGVATLKTTGNVVIESGADANITTTGKANINVGADCNVNVTGKAIIQASEVDVQGDKGMVLTTMTDPVIDTIFGEPTQGVPTFKAGQ